MPYYHKVTLSFNWWIIVALATIIVEVMLGLSQYKIRRNKYGELKIRKCFSDFPVKLATGVSSAAFGVLFILESWRGTLQLIENTMAEPSAPIIMFPFAIAAAILVFALMSYGIARISSYAKIGYLCGQLRKRRNEEAEER